MKKFQHCNFVIFLTGGQIRPILQIYKNSVLILTHSDKFGTEIVQGSCEDIVAAMKLIPEYFPRKVVNII